MCVCTQVAYKCVYKYTTKGQSGARVDRAELCLLPWGRLLLASEDAHNLSRHQKLDCSTPEALKVAAKVLSMPPGDTVEYCSQLVSL